MLEWTKKMEIYYKFALITNEKRQGKFKMSTSISFIRILFLCLCTLFVTSFTSALFSDIPAWVKLASGLSAGLGFGLIMISVETCLKHFHLRSFNTAALGLLFGYLMGEAILLLFQMMQDTNTLSFSAEISRVIRLAIILSCAYIGMMMTLRASEEIYISLPFLRFQPNNEKKRDILLDSSVLMDSRIIDLASSGLFDNHLVIPRFTLSEMYDLAEHGEENDKSKARRTLEVIKKLESMANLNLRFSETDFQEFKDPISKLVHLARIIEANILTTDINRVQQSTIEGVRIINLHSLSNALKPLTHSGEFLSIKIQRYGKEARQGVGYLEDGTMVVVNGGADYIGEVIKTQVLSVKHTSSGRMIFCNAYEEEEGNHNEEYEHSLSGVEDPNKSYFAV